MIQMDTLAARNRIYELDTFLLTREKSYPLFAARCRLWQSVYFLSNKSGDDINGNILKSYLDRANILIGKDAPVFLDSLAEELYEVAKYYVDQKAQDMFLHFDGPFRKKIMAKWETLNDYSITMFAWFRYDKYAQSQSAFLANYDRLFFKDVRSVEGVDDQLPYYANIYMILMGDRKEWINKKLKIKSSALLADWHYFTTSLYKRCADSVLRKDLPLVYKSFFLEMYTSYLYAWAEMAIEEQQTALVSVRVNQCLKEMMVPFMHVYAANDSIKKVWLKQFVNLGSTLKNLFNHSGQYQRAWFLLDWMTQQGNTISAPIFSEYWSLQRALGITEYYAGIQKQDSLADLTIRLSKIYHIKPALSAPRLAWEGYLQVRCKELEYYFSVGKYKTAIDSASLYLAEMMEGNTTDELPTKQMSSTFLYLIAKSLHANNKSIETALIFLQRAFDEYKNLDYLDNHLLIAMKRLRLELNTIRDKQVKNVVDLRDLLNYTNKDLIAHLHTLAPDQRVMYYKHQLEPIFNTYHTLLQLNDLEKLPSIRKQMIEQILTVRVAMLYNPNQIIEFIDQKEMGRQILEHKRRSQVIESKALILGSPKDYEAAIELAEMNTLMLETLRWTEQGLPDDILWPNLKLTQLDSIRLRLPEQSVYIETFRYQNFMYKDSVCYYALAISKEDSTRVIHLYSEASLESWMKLWGIQTNQLSRSTITKSSAVQSSTSKQRRISAMNILQPFFKSISNRTTNWLIVTDGWLSRLPLHAMETEDGFVLDKMNIQYVTSVNSTAKSIQSASQQRWLIAGGIDYNKDSCTSGLLKKDHQWLYLPGTQKEAQSIGRILNESKTQYSLLSKGDFNRIKQLQGYTHIHLATHGFYFDSSSVAKYYNSMYPMRFIQPSPLLRTGLAVSGANCGTTNIPGYLMGYELASEDLSNCRLMVLSACETALGDLDSHLGVAGIQRMLKLAGVQYILATLWKIPDAATAIFMEEFYKNLMRQNEPQQALVTTQKLLSKKMPVSDWGAFILIK